MTIFSATDTSFLNPCLDGNVHRYATPKEPNQKAFMAISQNGRPSGHLENEYSQLHFLSNMTILSAIYASLSNPW